MKKLINLFSAIAIAMAVVSCSSNDEETARSPYAGQELKFNVSVKGMEGLSTRVAANNSGIIHNTLLAGTQFSVFVYTSTAWGAEGTLKYNSDGSTNWVGDAVYFPPITPSTFAAISPAMSNIMSTLTYDGVSIQADQSTIENYTKSDYLFFLYGKESPISNPIDIEFEHICAKIVVNLILDTEFNDMQSYFTTKMKNISLTGLWDRNDGLTVKEGSSTSDITFGKGSSLTAVIIPQTINSGADLFEFSYYSSVYKFKAPETFNFVGGHTYTFNISIKNGKVSSESVSVSGWTNEDPKSGDATKS